MATNNSQNSKRLIRMLIAGMAVLLIAFMAILPCAFGMHWTFWSSDATATPVVENTAAPVVEVTATPVVITATPIVSVPETGPDTKFLLTFQNGEVYTYLPQLWQMDFGNVWGITMEGTGFEKIDEAKSVGTITIPIGFYAFVNVDGMGNHTGKAVFSNGTIVDFGKGNPAKIGNSTIVPGGTVITIPFDGNKSSGAKVVLATDPDMLMKYIEIQ